MLSVKKKKPKKFNFSHYFWESVLNGLWKYDALKPINMACIICVRLVVGIPRSVGRGRPLFEENVYVAKQ